MDELPRQRSISNQSWPVINDYKSEKPCAVSNIRPVCLCFYKYTLHISASGCSSRMRWILNPRGALLSGGSAVRPLQWPFSWLFFCPPLEARPAVPSFCQRRCLPQPQIKNAKGAARKSGLPCLSGLMSKMSQSSGNLLQSGILSLLLQRASQREGKREK